MKERDDRYIDQAIGTSRMFVIGNGVEFVTAAFTLLVVDTP